MKGKRIQFQYINTCECSLDTHWGCCCNCVFHLEVHKHCCNNIRKEKCICSESLDFYVCIDSRVGHANLSGKHGACEVYTARKGAADE